jgi:3-phenylpropionate/trans-cinnamate dioxygenase ferredoxin component
VTVLPQQAERLQQADRPEQVELPGQAEAAARPRLVQVAAVTDVPPGWVRKVRVGSREIALANSEGTFHAMDNACSHAGGPLGDNRLKEGCYLECPWHNAVFDARTGDVLRGPARKPVRMYHVAVQDGTVFVALD